MEIELKEIRDFIAAYSPFNLLADSTLDDLPRSVSIKYLRRGQPLVSDKHTEPCLYLIRSGALERRNQASELLEKLAEGDIYADLCKLRATESRVVAVEDTLLYLVSCRIINEFCEQSDKFNLYLTESIDKRLKRAVVLSQKCTQAYQVMQLEVGHLTDRTPVTIDSSTSIQKAAQAMSAENVSSILIMSDDELVGMITDRDLRNRCVAGSVSRKRPVSDIMTTDLFTMEYDQLLSEALILMTRHQVHHLPILKQQKPIGNLTVSDIIRHIGTNPAFIASDINKANSLDALIKISQKIPELQLQLALTNTTAKHISEVISTITDVITRRLLELAEEKLGPPPVPYVWAAGGSQARNEQTSHSDQDNALIIDNAMRPEYDDYFSHLSRFVSDGLDQCGYYYCPGDAMATNPKFRKPLKDWQQYFTDWIERPERKALMLSSIFFDMRAVYGEKALLEELQQQILRKTKINRIFIAHMVSNALTHKPPLGFFRSFVLVHDGDHDNTLDIKHRGVVPIVDIARVYALAGGIKAVGTIDRLKEAQQSGALSREMAENLIDAYELISRLKIQHQANLIRQARKPDNFLHPDTLSGLERDHLKDAFGVIKTMQDVLENRHQASRLA